MFLLGIEIEPNNKALWSALKSCQEVYEINKKQRYQAAQKERDIEEQRLNQREKLKKDLEMEKLRKQQEEQGEDLLSGFLSTIQEKGSSVRPTNDASITQENGDIKPEYNDEEDNLLAGFFTEVTANAEAAKSIRPPISHKADSSNNDGSNDDSASNDNNGRSEKELTEKYTNQDLGDGKAQCERLMSKHHEWKNLNPYAVMQLGIDATEEDIKYRYKKLSLKVHPDRLREVENAREAFEQVTVSFLFVLVHTTYI